MKKILERSIYLVLALSLSIAVFPPLMSLAQIMPPGMVLPAPSIIGGNIIGGTIDGVSTSGVPGNVNQACVTTDTTHCTWQTVGTASGVPASFSTITGQPTDSANLATALNAKAPLASPTFTGTVGGITAAMVGADASGSATAAIAGQMPGNAATASAVPVTGLTGSGTVSGLTAGNATSAVTATNQSGGTVSATTLTASSTVTLSPASANVAISPTGTGTVTINPATASAINNESIGVTTPLAGKFTTLTATASNTVTSASATALSSGLNGATNPAFNVDNSTASQAAGLNVKGAATGGTVALTAIDSGTNTGLSVASKGTGPLTFDPTGAGAVNIGTTNAASVTIGNNSIITTVDGIAEITNNVSGVPAFTSGTVLGLVGKDTSIARIQEYNYETSTGAPPTIEIYHSGGTLSSPLPPAANSQLGQLAAGGYNTSAYVLGASIRMLSATNTWSTTDHGSSMRFYTTPDASTTQTLALTIDQSQNLIAVGNISATAAIVPSATGIIAPSSTNMVIDTTSASAVQIGTTNAGSVAIGNGAINTNLPSTLSASSATTGALTIGNGTAATNVSIGGGEINVGGTITAGSTISNNSTGNVVNSNTVTDSVAASKAENRVSANGGASNKPYVGMIAYAQGNTATAYGITLGGYTAINASDTQAANLLGLLIGVGNNNSPIKFGTNNAIVQTITASGVAVTGAISATTTYGYTHILSSATAPTISSGFGSSPSILNNNGTAAFTVNVGTGGSASSGVITMPTATTGWACHVAPNGAPQAAAVTYSAPTSATSITLTNYTLTTGSALAWTASTVLQLLCTAY